VRRFYPASISGEREFEAVSCLAVPKERIVLKVLKGSNISRVAQAEDIRDILRLQDELVRHRALWDAEPWLELDMSTPQLKALLLISEEEGIRMRELARRLGGSFSNATVLVDRLVDRASWSAWQIPRTGGSCWSGPQTRDSSSSINSSPPGERSRLRC
jgi:hypothetical protein